MDSEKKLDKRLGIAKLKEVKDGVMTTAGNITPERKETRQITEKEINFIPCSVKTVVVSPLELALELSKIGLNENLPVADICKKAASKLGTIKSENRNAVNATLNYRGSVQGVRPEHQTFSQMNVPFSATVQQGRMYVKSVQHMTIVIPDMCFTLCKDSLHIIERDEEE
ncbi:MAG: hypothetical protein Q7S08_02080 [bacterium]|nr:hypothetical protein [bacterium]